MLALLTTLRAVASAESEMAAAARNFLAALPDEQKATATFEFKSDERENWHFIPKERKGVTLGSLKPAQKHLAFALLQSGLSSRGFAKAATIMSLEQILQELEGPGRRFPRDPELYHVSIFGAPDPIGTWGWRFEGHHLSLNFTLDKGEVIGSTPEFYGSNPALIEAGPQRSIRVLGTEEDLARQLIKLSTSEQLKLAWVDQAAPDDLRGANAPQAEKTPAVGLAAAKMNPDQQKLLGDLLEEYLKNMPADVAAKRRERLMKGGFEQIHFAWWGQTEVNQRHYYRIQGPTFLIEYNNTQNNANHVHSYWRDLGGDFGIPTP